MTIEITDAKSINEIQEEFSSKFPFLKIEFYSKAHQELQGSPKEFTISNKMKIGEIRTKHELEKLDIHGNMKVSTLEGEFKESLGLNVQVFRKSGNVWLQTIATDEWSLSEQNQKGEEMSE